MEGAVHGNRIGGEATPAASAGRFEVRAALDGAALGVWPRSGPDDVRAGLAALRAGAQALAALGAGERARRAVRALEALGDDEELAGWLARRLGATVDELASHRGRLARRAVQHLRAAVCAGGTGGATVVIPDWTELLYGTALGVLSELVSGRPVLYLADPRLPELGDALLRALAASGLPPESVALLHGADIALLRAAVRAPEVRRAVVSGPPARVAGVQAAAAARPPAAPLETVLDVPRGGTLELGAGAAERAAEVVEHAFGRARTLSGQLPSRIEAVRCEARAFSAFTAALLAELEAAPDARDPVPLIDAEALVDLFEVRARGLDEGATPIHGGLVAGREHAPSVRPLVFTNVEEEMQLFALPAPGPLLRLVRVQERRGAAAAFGRASGAG